jgi:toxin YoeB
MLDEAKDDYLFLEKSGNKAIVKKAALLLKEIENHPFSGAGKPERLKYQYAGLWSRRINTEHRIVYKVENTTVYIISMRFHYD